MKNISIKDTLYLVACVICFSMGFVLANEVNYTEDRNQMESDDFKVSLILKQQIALEQATRVIINNGLLDKDGSDNMAEYLRLYSEVDSLWNTIP